MVLHQLGSACNFSGSCHVVSAKSYQVHRVMIFGHWDELGICSIGSAPCRCALAVPYSNLRYWHKTGKIVGKTFVSPKFPPRVPVFFQMFKVSHVFHHLFPSFSPFLSSMFSLPPWNSPFQARRSRGETSPAQRWFHGCVSGYTTRSCESHAACSERIRKARNLWCGTFWIIGHDWSLKVWMDSIQVVWYESTFWIDMTSLEHI